MHRLLAVVLVLLATPAIAEPPRVVATIKPIHSLVAAVMDGVGTPTLLVKGGASPHTYSLRPSDASALEQATVIFRVGHGFEVFLDDALATLASDAEVVALATNPGIKLLPVRHAVPGETGREHEDEEYGNDHGALDMHAWLNPTYATFTLSQIADVLAGADPENMDTYFDNARAEQDRILDSAAELFELLKPVQARPFILFHDATHYFEDSFRLVAIGSVTLSPEVPPGAQRIAALRRLILDFRTVCVFAEPNFDPAIVATLVEGTPARIGTLDPEASLLEEGPGLYRALLRDLAESFAACLSEAGR